MASEEKKPSEALTAEAPDERRGSSESCHILSPPKRIGVWSALGTAYSATCAPIAIFVFLVLTVGSGGTPIFIYSYLVALTFNMTVCVSLAEMASAKPHSAGQTYWSAAFAPPGSATGYSYYTGFFASCTWLLWYISAPLIAAQLILATAQVISPDFAAEPWHTYVTFIGVLFVTYIMNINLFSVLQYVNRASLVVINLGSLYIFITLLVRAETKRPSRDVWVDIVNENGWGTGVNFLLSFAPALNCVSGFDSAAHLSEEMQQPHRDVPIVMVGSACLSGMAAFIMIMAFSYCTTNADNLLNAIGGQPGIQLMMDTFRSFPLTLIGSLIFVLVLANAGTCLMTVNSRMMWAMARQNGLPASWFLGRLGSRLLLPRNAACVSVVIAIGLGAIQLGSTVVVNGILGSAIICCNVSYAIPILLLLFSKDRNAALGGRPWFSLGRLGPVVNSIAVVWLTLASITLAFPTVNPVDASTVNLAPVFVAAVGILGVGNWFLFSKNKYLVPGAV